MSGAQVEGSTVAALLARGARVEGHRPWPRARVDADTRRMAGDKHAAGR
jgi:hypothetical protein